jgi:hypothetical protein
MVRSKRSEWETECIWQNNNIRSPNSRFAAMGIPLNINLPIHYYLKPSTKDHNWIAHPAEAYRANTLFRDNNNFPLEISLARLQRV